MTVLMVGGVCLTAGFVTGFLVCRHNYGWVKNLEAKAVQKAKDVTAGL